jgi:bifunctional DNase/RNase
MRIAELRRTQATESGVERHILFLEDDQGRRLPIWIGPPEATAMALVIEQVKLPRPGVYQFAASLLAGAGGRLREVRVTELTKSTFYAQAILTDDTSVDARPSDALTLALVTEAPIYVAAGVLERVQETSGDWNHLLEEADAAADDSRVIADDAIARYTAHTAQLENQDD